jgi:drug/metabolite transporter (DMT)-like permease
MTDILPIVLAILTAILFGLSKIFIRKGISDVDPNFGVFITLLPAIPILTFFVIISGEIRLVLSVSLSTLLYLFAAGVLSLILGRVFAYTSIDLIGAARSSQLTSLQLVFAVILGLIFLQETLDILMALGIVIIGIGLIFVSTSSPEGDSKIREGFFKGVVFGLLGGLAWAFSQLFAKVGVQSVGSPITAVFISYIFAIAIQAIIVMGRKKGKLLRKSSTVYLLVSGFLTVFALLSQFTALKLAQLVEVVPIFNTSPLITVLFSHFLIQKLELLNWKVWVGSLLVVIGAYFVTS